MSDDLNGQPPLPPQSNEPFPRAPAPTPAPTFVSPPEPQRDRTQGADSWPGWFALATLFGGVVAAGVIAVVIIGVLVLFGYASDSPTATVVGSIVQEFVFVGVAVGVALSAGIVTPRDFGLVRPQLKDTLLKIVAIAAIYFVALAVYSAAVHLTADDSPNKLGADKSLLAMLAFAFFAGGLAPLAEEIFFRGMIFRSLKNALGLVWGAIISGLIFGSLHIDSLSHARLLQVVPLALFGILLAFLYHWSGTLYATIALHSTNNSIAVFVYAADHHSSTGAVFSVFIWLAMMAFCLNGWRLTDKDAGTDEPPAMDSPERPVVYSGS